MRLADSFGCCALFSHRDDEEPLDDAPRQNNGGVCYDEPRPMTSHSMNSHPSKRTPPARGPSSKGSQRSNKLTSTPGAKLVISAPTDFRHVNGADGLPHPDLVPIPEVIPVIETTAPDPEDVAEIPVPTRRGRSYRPLELSIYLPECQLSPLPNFDRQSWQKKVVDLAIPPRTKMRDGRRDSASSLWSGFSSRRRTAISRTSRTESNLSIGAVSNSPRMPEEPLPTIPSSRPAQDRVLSHPHMPARNSSLMNVSNISDDMEPPVPTLPSSEPITAFQPTTTKPAHRTTQSSVDSAIRELEALVLHRRTQTNPSAHSPSPTTTANNSNGNTHHIPAIAPNLKIQARSETLSDIGSAFSAPFVTKPLPSVPPSPTYSTDNPTTTSTSRNPSLFSLTHFPTPPTTASSPATAKKATAADQKRAKSSASRSRSRSKSQSKSKLASWVRRSVPEPDEDPVPVPFYKCRAGPGQEVAVAVVDSVGSLGSGDGSAGEGEEEPVRRGRRGMSGGVEMLGSPRAVYQESGPGGAAKGASAVGLAF